MDRPDLGNTDPGVRAYIEYLEAELGKFRGKKSSAPRSEIESEAGTSDEVFPKEPPTTLQAITFTQGFLAKRTARHLYNQQRRGGMGIFDLDAPEDDRLAGIVIADENQSVLLFTNLGRVFRLAVNQIVSTEVRGRGQTMAGKIILLPGERLVSILPDIAKGAIALVSQQGYVRYLRHHIFGEYMKPGANLLDVRHFGELVAATRTPGDSDLFIATRQGKGIRFSEKLVPPQGGLGIRLEKGDSTIAITSADDESLVFLADEEGNGTIRSMSSFGANKSAGGGGKIAMKTDALISASRVESGDTLFMLSRLGKVIRFSASEVPIKDGVVQGVHCMALRSDQVISSLATR